MIFDDIDTISLEMSSNMSITHAASEYVSARFRSPSSDVLPPPILDTHLVLACDHLVNNLIQASKNHSMMHSLI